MFETRKKLYAILMQYMEEIETLIATAESDYDAAVKEHAKHLSDSSFDEGDLAREQDSVESIYDVMQDSKCELDILKTFRTELFSNWEAIDNEH